MSLVNPRIIKQAEILVDYSLKVKKGEKIIIIASSFYAAPLVYEVYRLLVKRGAHEVRVHFSPYELEEIFYDHATKDQIAAFPKISMNEIENVDCYIRIDAPENTRGLTGVDSNLVSERARVIKPILDWRVEKTRWVVTRFPTHARAQEADMSLTNYTEFVFDAIVGVDWKKKSKEQEKLAKLLSNTSEVRIIGLGTELVLGKKGRTAVNAGGEYNMPDGEVFTSVLENRVDGVIAFTYPAIYGGREFDGVRLEFKNGKVTKATAEKGELELNKILSTDKGAKSIGELGIGNNFQIDRFTKDILFDEKIGGTIHLALGRGYKETGSKNESAIHWDMIKDLREGGELWFDNRLVQKNGKWLVKL